MLLFIRYPDDIWISPNLDSAILRRYLDSDNPDSQNLDSQSLVRDRVRIRVFVRVRVRVRVSYDCAGFECSD